MHRTRKETITFGNNEVEKLRFNLYKSPILINDVGISKIVVSNRVSFGKKVCKYFVVYEEDKKGSPSWIILPKMGACGRDFDENKYMYFLIKNIELLRKYNEIWDNPNKVIKN